MAPNPEIKPVDQAWPDGVGMIYLAMSPWNGMWKNRHQLMSRFAAVMPVLYVEPSKKLSKVRKQGLLSSRLLEEFRSPPEKHLQDRLHIFQSPDYLAVSGSRLLQSVTEDRWLRAIKKSAARIGITRPILWISIPALQFAAGRLGESLSIYHVVDEYSGYTLCDESRRRKLKELELELLDKVDLVIVVSPELKKSKMESNRDIHLVENAVDFDAFQDALKCNNVPADLADVSSPRLGYSGLIGKRLNLELLEQTAHAHPDWSIVLIGKVDRRDCEVELERLEKLENVHFMGEKHHDQVPAYMSGLDIGLLPYDVNVETSNISPLKMYEYLAVGIPIVSTNIPAAIKKKDFVVVALDIDGFIEGCEMSLNIGDELRSKRVEEASTNTWENRVQEISDLIGPRLRRSGPDSED